jgi:hypothetical protein
MFSWFEALKIKGLSTMGFILFLISIRLFIACNITPKITKISNRIQNSKLFKRRIEETPAVELENILNVNPEAVYNPPSANEPAYVRKYAPLPLQASNTNKTSIQKYAPNSPSAPNITQSQNPHFSHTNILNKISPTYNKTDSSKCAGPHTTCSYITGYGMVWEDLCRCDENDATA